MKKLILAILVIAILSYAVDCFGMMEPLYIETDSCFQSFSPVYKCERCGYETTVPICVYGGDDYSYFCPKCIKKWCDKNMPKMEVVDEKVGAKGH